MICPNLNYVQHVRKANLEVREDENHNNSSYDFQVDNNVNIEPYTMFLQYYEVSFYKGKI